MNRQICIGNLTRDPESRTVGEKTVCNFTVAVNRRRKVENQPEADFFRVSAWGNLGVNCQKYLTKGKKVAVTGAVSVHPYKDSNGEPRATLELFADDVEFLSPAGSAEQAPAQESAPEVQPNMTPVDPVDLPF